MGHKQQAGELSESFATERSNSGGQATLLPCAIYAQGNKAIMCKQKAEPKRQTVVRLKWLLVMMQYDNN